MSTKWLNDKSCNFYSLWYYNANGSMHGGKYDEKQVETDVSSSWFEDAANATQSNKKKRSIFFLYTSKNLLFYLCIRRGEQIFRCVWKGIWTTKTLRELCKNKKYNWHGILYQKETYLLIYMEKKN